MLSSANDGSPVSHSLWPPTQRVSDDRRGRSKQRRTMESDSDGNDDSWDDHWWSAMLPDGLMGGGKRDELAEKGSESLTQACTSPMRIFMPICTTPHKPDTTLIKNAIYVYVYVLRIPREQSRASNEACMRAGQTGAETFGLTFPSSKRSYSLHRTAWHQKNVSIRGQYPFSPSTPGQRGAEKNDWLLSSVRTLSD